MRAFKGSKINLVVSKGAEMVSVPDVKGQSRSDAVSRLESAGFKVEYTEDEYSTDIEAGKVCKQNPEGGTKAPKESTVKITISKGIESATVPNVVGKTESEAISILKAAGFDVSVSYSTSSDDDEGKVISQSPSSGKADKGSTINITVSKGSGNVEVPDVVGMTYEAAKAKLQAAGFNVQVSGAGSKVISQSPLGGNKVAKGSTITITLG